MDLNTQLFYFINNYLSNPVFDAVLPHFTHLGGFTVIFAITIVLFIVSRKNLFNTGRYYGLVKLIAAALILMIAITATLKLMFHMPRPFVILDHVNLPSLGGFSPAADPNSFPSGHCATTAAVSSVIILKSKEYFEKYKLVSASALLFFVVIAFSRIYVGMHFPIDVACGSIIGMVCGVVVCRFLKV